MSLRSRYLLSRGHNRKAGDAQERETSAALHGKPQPNSGAVANVFMKEDVIANNFLVQTKLTGKPSFRITAKEFALTTDRALRQNKCPVWRLEMEGADVAVVRWTDLRQMIIDAGMR